MLYKKIYNSIPPKRLAHPSITRLKDFSISLPARFTKSATTRKTNINDITGNHFPPVFIWIDKRLATNEDNLSAAANPAIKPNTENIAIINPFRIPLMHATITRII